MLTDQTQRENILPFYSYKFKRIVRPVLRGETYALSEGFDVAYMLWHDLQLMIGRRIPLTMLTDSESLFKVIVKEFINK